MRSTNNKYNIEAPQTVLNFIEQYYAYSHLVASSMYTLKNTPLLKADGFIDKVNVLQEKEFKLNDETIKFSDITSIGISILSKESVPTEFDTNELSINAPDFYSDSTIFHGDVEFNVSKSFILNHTFFNKEAVVKINGKELTSDELEHIRGNVFELCAIDLKIAVETSSTSKAEIDRYLKNYNNLRELAKDNYKEALNDIKTWSYYKAAFVPDLQKCVNPIERKVFKIDFENSEGDNALHNGMFSPDFNSEL